MIKGSRGFTIIELSVVVVIVGILTALIAVGVTQYQRVSRDALRETTVTTVIEGLEKYYLENGEYPSVPALTTETPVNVATTISVDAAALKMPHSTTEVAIVPPGSTGTDVMVYDGTSSGSSANCQIVPSVGCDSFELTYQKETGGSVTIKSRREGGNYPTTTLAPPKPSLTTQSGGGVIVESQSSETACAIEHTPKYSFRNQTSGGSWSGWSAWQTATTYTFSGAQGATYELQAQTRCDRDITSGTASLPSDIESFTVPVNAPTAPTLTVTLSGSTVLATAGTTTCPSGYAAQYALRSRTNNGTWGVYSAWSATRTASQTAARGVRYGYQVQARCYSAALTSGTSASSEVVYTHPLLAPAAPTVQIEHTTVINGYSYGGHVVGAVTCPSNSSAQYQGRSGDDGSLLPDGSAPAGFKFYSWTGVYSSPPNSTGYTQREGNEYAYEAQARCTNAYSTSPWSATGSDRRIIPMPTPGGSTNFVSNMNATKTEFNWTWTSPNCQAGSTRNIIVTWHWNEGTPNEWHPTSAQGNYIGVATFTVQGGAPLPSGNKLRASVRNICINNLTGRTSAWSPEASSPTYIVP